MGQGFDGAHLDELVARTGPHEIEGLVPKGWSVKGRTGVGTPADVPWIGIFSPAGGSTAQEGLYLVYLFAKDGSAVYLSLNQGTEQLAQPEVALRKRVLDIRTIVGAQPDLEVQPDLKSTNLRPKKYEWGSALAVRYGSDSIPQAESLQSDLERMTGLLESALTSGISFDPKIEPTHLLFKWNSDVERETVAVHREISEVEGQVWWGRFAQPGAPKVSTQKVAQLQSQIATGCRHSRFSTGEEASGGLSFTKPLTLRRIRMRTRASRSITHPKTVFLRSSQ